MQLVTFKHAVQTFPSQLIPSDIAALVAYDPMSDDSVATGDSAAAKSSYLRDREGPAVCSLIDVTKSSVLPDMGVGLQEANRAATVVLGDVAVRGGKWYYEVRVMTGYICHVCAVLIHTS